MGVSVRASVPWLLSPLVLLVWLLGASFQAAVLVLYATVWLIVKGTPATYRAARWSYRRLLFTTGYLVGCWRFRVRPKIGPKAS